MPTSAELRELCNHAFAKRDKALRDHDTLTREWWDGYRSALQVAIGVTPMPKLKKEADKS